MASGGRAAVAERITALVGHDVLTMVNVQDGWPALASLRIENEELPVSLYVGHVGLSHRGRDDVERRFQNPSGRRPIMVSDERYPLLLGLWDEDPVLTVTRPLLVAGDPFRRHAHSTRFSVFVSVSGLLEAHRSGWCTTTSGSDETLRCLLPPMLPVSVSLDRDGTRLAEAAVRTAVDASGLTDTMEDPVAAARARRATMALVRDERFADQVMVAYRQRCAMCGLGIPLLQAAHIYPVAAPGSHDRPWNGLALCPNHHLAFDRHLVGVVPATGEIRFEATLHDQAGSDPAARALVETTFATLAVPVSPDDRPRPVMFYRRYEHFAGRYEWLHIT